MTLATHEEEIVDAEIVLTDSDAEDFDLRFQYALGGYAEARQELIDCIQFVRGSDVAERLGFKSRGDYIADRVAGLNVKWAVEDRRSLVEIMAFDPSGTMSTPQIAKSLGVGNGTAWRDMDAVRSASPNGEAVERCVEGSDGKTYTYEAKPEPTVSERDWPVVPEPDDYTEPTPEEKVQRFEETRQRLIDQGLIPPDRTPEEKEEAAERFVSNLLGKAAPKPRAAETPAARWKRALSTITALMEEGEAPDTSTLTDGERAVYKRLTREEQ